MLLIKLTIISLLCTGIARAHNYSYDQICKYYNNRIIYKYEGRTILYNCAIDKPSSLSNFNFKKKLYNTLSLHKNINCRFVNNRKICVNNGILYLEDSNVQAFILDIENELLNDLFSVPFPPEKFSNIHTEAKITYIYNNLYYLNDFDYDWSLCKRRLMIRIR